MDGPRMRMSAAVLGAADFQPREHVRLMLDPAGHPFCLFEGEV